ncbi:hypothetical protein SARC_10806 [Sphaeroforma arctica JP610]|uniref:Uncharacterized protein n=1 Tax=Sphaeroforma arctica JP610 TaxID=667725 RepID=A0A0L0FIV6_9EUKA|nr:hypothetical protein SARC_10806 [Sphaeroforma arctica JP610]KNC76709.1 hypothetical protein SARC_10806 [Sphaeroforma arctica JP610]|eukprot:XP_014150611.1 hypothetical protein SARC_10806 [Sphaeroforma arctica JP610]
MTATKVLVTPLSGVGKTGKYERTNDVHPVINKYDKFSDHDPLADTALPWLKASAETELSTAGVEKKCAKQDQSPTSLHPARLESGLSASIEVLHDDMPVVAKNNKAPLKTPDILPVVEPSRRIPSIAEELLVAKRENQIRYAVCAAFRKVPKKPSKFTKLERRPFRYSDDLQMHVKKQAWHICRATKLYIDWWRTAYFTGGSDVFCALFCDLRLRRGIDGIALDHIKEMSRVSLFEGVVSLNNSSRVRVNAPADTYSDEDETKIDYIERSNEHIDGAWTTEKEYESRHLPLEVRNAKNVQAKRSFSGGPTLKVITLKRSNSASRTRSNTVADVVSKRQHNQYGHTTGSGSTASGSTSKGSNGSYGKSVMKTIKDKTTKATGVKSIKKGVRVIERATRASVRAAPQAMFGLSRVRTNSGSGNSRTSTDESVTSRERISTRVDDTLALRATASYESGFAALEERFGHREEFCWDRRGRADSCYDEYGGCSGRSGGGMYHVGERERDGLFRGEVVDYDWTTSIGLYRVASVHHSGDDFDGTADDDGEAVYTDL